MMTAPTGNNRQLVETMVQEYQSIGMQDQEILSAMTSDGFPQDVVRAALNRTQSPREPRKGMDVSRNVPERHADICAKIQSLYELKLHKTDIRLLAMDNGVSAEEFDTVWNSHFAIASKWEGRFILAQDGVNQYSSGSPAGCSLMACRFLASAGTLNSKELSELIRSTNYKGDRFLDMEACIAQYKELVLIDNPWEEQRYLSNTMQVVFDRRDMCSLQKATQTILSYDPLFGALIVGNGLTIGLRKTREHVEIFDSHGDSTITREDNTAYVIRFGINEVDEVTAYLERKFPDIGFSGIGLGGIEIWPLGYASQVSGKPT